MALGVAAIAVALALHGCGSGGESDFSGAVCKTTIGRTGNGTESESMEVVKDKCKELRTQAEEDSLKSNTSDDLEQQCIADVGGNLRDVVVAERENYTQQCIEFVKDEKDANSTSPPGWGETTDLAKRFVKERKISEELKVLLNAKILEFVAKHKEDAANSQSPEGGENSEEGSSKGSDEKDSDQKTSDEKASNETGGDEKGQSKGSDEKGSGEEAKGDKAGDEKGSGDTDESKAKGSDENGSGEEANGDKAGDKDGSGEKDESKGDDAKSGDETGNCDQANGTASDEKRDPKAPTCGGNAGGAPCHFPFEFKGVKFSECTHNDEDGACDDRAWCDIDDTQDNWGYCDCEATVDESKVEIKGERLFDASIHLPVAARTASVPIMFGAIAAAAGLAAVLRRGGANHDRSLESSLVNAEDSELADA